MGRTHILCAVAALVVAAAHGPAADDPLRKQALRLNDITGQDAISGKILELIKDKDEVKKLVAAAAGMAKEKEQPFNYNGAYILAKAAYVTKDFDSSLAFYRICADQAVKLKSGQKLVDVYDGLIMLFQDHKKYDEVIKTCEEFLDLKGGQTVDQAKPFVAEKLVLALAKQKKFDDALKMTEKLLSNTDGNWYFNRLKADVLREAGKNEEAIDAFEETIEKLNKANFKDEQEKVRDAMIERCRYVMSGVFTDMGQVDKATEQLRKLLKAHPESSTYNNDLGYVLADNDKDLDEAEKLVRKALDLDKAERAKLKEKGLLDADEDKENAAYLDSLGWVLYKKKNYAEAKKHLLEASKTDEGKHVEIFDHLADVHKAMGEKADAVAVWQKALELEDVSKRDMSRKEAIKKKLAQESGDTP
jgi:tetratricopeptide (TPR) repeat protein